MGKALIITEKPSVARDIVEAVGGFQEAKAKAEFYESDDYVCTYAVGHILTLLEPEDISPQYKKWRLADLPIIPEKFAMKPSNGQSDRINVIKKLLARKDIDRVINACDAAREGELIFREIIEFLECKKPIYRLWLQSMTKNAIRSGFTQLEEGMRYEGLASAARCRAHADWLIGMNATRALTVRLKSRNQVGMSWSAGRVQTPTLALLVSREIEILEHVPIPYWKLSGQFMVDNNAYEGTWYDPQYKKDENKPESRDDRIFDEALANKILADISKAKSAKASETRKPRPSKAPNLFDLTSLQRKANSRFGWSAVRTLRAAQRCYETHKMLTYPRTSSNCLPSDYVAEVQKTLDIFAEHQTYAPYAQYLKTNGLLNQKAIFDDAGVTDHFAIIPTGEVRVLEGDDAKLYDLVTRHFFAAFYPPAIYEEVERTTIVAENYFRSRPPKILREAGWEAVFDKKPGTGEEKGFFPLIAGKDKAENVPVNVGEVKSERQETKPPSRITEAGLLSMMENAGRHVEDEELASALKQAEGLGTAATRADIIENLKVREYIDSELRPTVKGIRLIDILHRINASRLTSAELTARLELFLNEVETGKREAEKFMTEIKSYCQDIVQATREFDYDQIYPNEKPLGPCPKCSGTVYERAWFYGCDNNGSKKDAKGKCDFLIWKDHNGRYIDRINVSQLLEKGVTRELDGFKSANGNTYRAVLQLINGTLNRKMVEGSQSEDVLPEGMELNLEPFGVCPLHGEGCQIVETPSQYLCTTKKKAKEAGETGGEGFSFPRILCKREIKRDDVIKFLGTGATDFLQGFVSKKGRKFSAKLVARPDKINFDFVFPERGEKKPKGEAKAEVQGEAQPNAGAGA